MTHNTTVSDVIAAVSELTGSPAELVNTGGGCGAIEIQLEGGAFILITDEDVLDFYSGVGQPFEAGSFVGLYTGDNDDSPLFLTTMHDTTPEDVAGMVRALLTGQPSYRAVSGTTIRAQH